MVTEIGYLEPRPIAEDYDQFVEKFQQTLSQLQPSTCFYIYGSYARKEHDVGRSDIDGGLILDSGIVTDKETIRQLSLLLRETLEKHRPKLQFNLTDSYSNKDGRFLSYTQDYTDYIRQHGLVLCGPRLIDEMNGLEAKSGVLHTTAYNFRKMRNGLLFSEDNKENDYKRFVNDFYGSLEAVSGLPKKIIILAGGEVIPQRFGANGKLSELLPGLDLTTLEKIEWLFRKPEELDKLYQKPNEVTNLWEETLTTFERIVRAYIRKYPMSRS